MHIYVLYQILISKKKAEPEIKIWVHVYLQSDSRKACEDGRVRRQEQGKILRLCKLMG